MKALLETALFLGLISLARFYPLEDVDDSDSDSSEYGVVPSERINNCTCGWANKEDQRIVGGKPTKVNEYPLMAGFVYLPEDRIYCGGTIITQRHIVTAGHCTFGQSPSIYGVYVGHHNYEQEKRKGPVKLLEIQEFFLHENYNDPKLKYDIAVVLMKDPIIFNMNVGPACLPIERIPLEGERLKVLGWGKIDIIGKLSDVLLKVYLDVKNLDLCVRTPTYELEMNDVHQICTYRRNKDSCKGDSGGPLLWLDPDTNRYTLVGATSYGLSCNKYPAVSTEIYYFLPWIQRIIAKTDPSQKTCAKM